MNEQGELRHNNFYILGYSKVQCDFENAASSEVQIRNDLRVPMLAERQSGFRREDMVGLVAVEQAGVEPGLAGLVLAELVLAELVLVEEAIAGQGPAWKLEAEEGLGH